MLTEKLISLIEARGLDPEILVRHGVDGFPERGSAWLQIPYAEAGQVVGVKYRTIGDEKDFFQKSGSKQVFWNVDCLVDETLDNHPLVITEGEFDAFAAMQAGYQRVVSVPGGAPEQSAVNTPSKYQFLEFAPRLDGVREIILAVDGDTNGIVLMNDLAQILGRARCKWVKYPKGCKDLNDALREYGVKGVQETLRRAQWVKVRGLARMSELPPLKPHPVHDVGVPGLYDHFRLRVGDLSVVIGVPGHGKTAFLNAVSCHMATAHGWNIAAASFEQRTQVDHKRNLRTYHGGRRVIDMSDAEIARADEWIDKHFVFAVPELGDRVNLEYMLEWLQAAAVQYGVKLATIDPVNCMEHERPSNMSETEYYAFMLDTLKRTAVQLQMHIMLAIHPAKLQRQKQNNEYPIPTLYDAHGSAHFYNKSDAGIIVHRNPTETLIRVQKTKYHDELGVPDDVFVNFNMATGRYEAPAMRAVPAPRAYAD